MPKLSVTVTKATSEIPFRYLKAGDVFTLGEDLLIKTFPHGDKPKYNAYSLLVPGTHFFVQREAVVCHCLIEKKG